MGNVASILQAGFAVYFAVAAIRGKSKIFYSRYTKKEKETQYRKTGRIGYAAISVLLLLLSGIGLYAGSLAEEDAALEALATVNYVLVVILLTALLGLMLLLNRMQDKSKKQAATRSTAPRAAFYFDEEEAPPTTTKKGKKP